MCVYDIWDDKEIEFAHKQYHTRLGSRILNDLLIVFLSDVFKVDYEDFKQAINSNHLDYLELMRNFEAIKRLVGDDSSKPITLKLPISFKDHINQVSGFSLEEALSFSELRNCVTLVKGSIRMDRQIIDMIFKDLINQTINIVIGLDNHFTKNNTKITHTILTGGFSECKLLQNEMKLKVDNVQTPNDCGVSALKGAVIYGHDLEAISRLNTTENSVYTLEEFWNMAGIEPINEISSVKRNLLSGLRKLQEQYEEEYHMMCGLEHDISKENEVLSEDGAVLYGVLDHDSTMESQIVDDELCRQEEERIRTQKEEEMQAQREAEELEKLMIAEQQLQNELEALKRQKEVEEQREREIEVQRQREAEENRQREAAEAQRQREAEEKRKRDVEVQREREIRRLHEAEEQRLRAIEHQKGLAAAAERRRLEELEKKKKKSSVCNIL